MKKLNTTARNVLICVIQKLILLRCLITVIIRYGRTGMAFKKG